MLVKGATDDQTIPFTRARIGTIDFVRGNMSDSASQPHHQNLHKEMKFKTLIDFNTLPNLLNNTQQTRATFVKRWNTLGCFDQYTAPNSKYTGGECPTSRFEWPPQMQVSASTPQNVVSTFDEQDKHSSERTGMIHPHPIRGECYPLIKVPHPQTTTHP